MHISHIHLHAFKRFHDINVYIDGSPRLVVLCGPNGIGKSSLLDGLKAWHSLHHTGAQWNLSDPYFVRQTEPVQQQAVIGAVDFGELPDQSAVDPRKFLYIRSAYRHEPEFTVSAVGRAGDIADAPKAQRLIETESKVSDNYLRLISSSLTDIYSGEHDTETVKQLRDRHILVLRENLQVLFPDLLLEGPGDPLAGGTFFFTKGNQSGFRYQNLSGGEKAAFDLLLDLVVKSEFYDNTVVCLDEPELHMNARLQANLLDVMLSILPENNQLWVSTHSIGMLRRAFDIWSGDPASTTFLDFTGLDLDSPVTLRPATPSREFWKRTLDVALGDLATLVAPSRIVLCEGKPATATPTPKSEFDAKCYRTIFATEFPMTDFVSVGNSLEVEADAMQLGSAVQALVTGTAVIRLIDRDLRTDDEISALHENGIRVLRRRQIESYLLDVEILAALCDQREKPEELPAILQAWDDALAESVGRGNDPDDFKRASGRFYELARTILALTQAGQSLTAFLTDTLAPLMSQGMATYAELRSDIFEV